MNCRLYIFLKNLACRIKEEMEFHVDFNIEILLVKGQTGDCNLLFQFQFPIYIFFQLTRNVDGAVGLYLRMSCN